VSAAIRYAAVSAARTRAPLAPAAASVFLLIGTYLDGRNTVGATYGLTALLCCGLAAWLVAALLAAEPAPQADMAAVAFGGRTGRARLDVGIVALAAGLLTVAFVAYPLLLGLVVDGVFEAPGPRLGDVVAAVLAHASCALLGGALGLLLSPPRIRRRATTLALALGTLLVLAAVGAVAGPVAVAGALDDAAAGTITGATVAQCLGCCALAAAALAAAPYWAARAG
jgi:hypothetical protein